MFLSWPEPRHEARLSMRKRAEHGGRLLWGSILACSVARTVASTMFELPGARGADCDTTLHRMLCRMAGSPVWFGERSD